VSSKIDALEATMTFAMAHTQRAHALEDALDAALGAHPPGSPGAVAARATYDAAYAVLDADLARFLEAEG